MFERLLKKCYKESQDEDSLIQTQRYFEGFKKGRQKKLSSLSTKYWI